MDNELPVNLTPQLYARVARMLREYEAGNFTPPPPGKTGQQHGGDESATFKVTAHASGGGKYILQLLQPGTTDVTESGNLALSELGTPYTPTSTTTKYIGFNLNEMNQETHAIDIGRVVSGTIERRQTNGIIVVHFDAYAFEDDCEIAGVS